MRAVPASALGAEALTDLWNRAYEGYAVPMTWTTAQLERHVLTGDVDLDRSIVWLDDGSPAALSLLGVRSAGADRAGLRGWIGGFGLAAGLRGRGLSSGLMAEHLAHAAGTGVAQVRLEVLSGNVPAQRAYERSGFAATRRLAVLSGTLTPADSGAGDVRWDDTAGVDTVVDALSRLRGGVAPAWTREAASVRAAWRVGGVRCALLGPRESPEGVLLVSEAGGGLRVVDAAAGDDLAARALAEGVAVLLGGRRLTLVNEPEGSPLVAAFAAVGVPETMSQVEMHRPA